MIATICTCVLCVVAGAASDVGERVHNGGFELPAPKIVPPGWAMWGARQDKVPAHFTRDATDPHSGKACFRIHHPAGTNGYVVTHPDHALRTAKGWAYRVRFWARTDVPGDSVFYLEGYESLRPYRDAPSPGRWPVKAGKRWREFTFEVHEGRDFLADRTRFLLLAFRPTYDRKLTKTLWIDDVSVTEQPSDVSAGFVEESTLSVAPLNHRLRPGKELAFTVDPARRIGPATRRACGVSFHRVAGYGRHPYDQSGRYVLEPALERAVRDLHLPMSRLYAVGDEPFGLTGSLDRVADICRRMGVDPATMVLELETQSASSKLPPATWAQAAAYAKRRGYRFRHWEVSNEPYTRKATAFDSPSDYAAHFLAVAAAIRKAQPDAQIGLPIHHDSRPWSHGVLKATAGHYDFVVGHYYSNADAYRLPLEDVALTANYRTLKDILRVNALMGAYSPQRPAYQLDTEWGLACSGPKGEGTEYAVRNANIVGTLHRAVRLIYYVREGMLRGASSWEMFSRLKRPGFGVLSRDAPDLRMCIYWLYYYMNRHVGRWALATEGTAPYHTPKDKHLAGPLTPVLATLTADGRAIHLVVANGSATRGVPCRISLRGFRATGASGVTLRQAGLDDSPLVRRKAEFIHPLSVPLGSDGATFPVAPRSIVFVTLQSETTP